MYRLIFYFLTFLSLVAVAFSALGILPFNPIALIFSVAFLTLACWISNTFFARVFRVQTNLESVYITALILALIVTPVRNLQDALLLGLVAVLSQGSKYILAVNKKHIFNPAAFAVAMGALAFKEGASWWVGTSWMAPFVLVGGLLIVRKIRRFSLVLSYLIVSIIAILGSSAFSSNNPLIIIKNLILDSPIIFFSLVMLTEPQTTPPGKFLQITYGGLVGFLFAPFVRLGTFSFSPEMALLAGNIFSYLLSPKEKLLLKIKEKIQIAPDIYDFVFDQDRKLVYLPGQYMEWTLGHKNPDRRGTRRYFTIAASPTEENLRIGVRFSQNGSSFKKALISMSSGDSIIASQLSGEFTLPRDPSRKLVFIAGGIGVTPYRSMIKYLLDTEQKRDMVLFYASKKEADFVYSDIFDKAEKSLGMKTVYVLTESENVPKSWQGKVGQIDKKMIAEEVPDYHDRIFYISGPHSMVDVFEKVLKGLGIAGNQIKIDFFPGYA